MNQDLLMTSANSDDVMSYDDDDDDDDYCHVYATVREMASSQGHAQGQIQGRGYGVEGHEDEVQICAGSRRQQRVYTSTSNVLSVRLSSLVFDDPTANFLLKYVGNFDVSFPLLYSTSALVPQTPYSWIKGRMSQDLREVKGKQCEFQEGKRRE